MLCCISLLVGCQNSGVSSSSQQLNVPGMFVNSIGMTMVRLPMGYYVSKYETRQSEFETVMGYNPSKFPGADHPVETVTATEADEFCRRLTQLERENGTLPEGYVYDLPTFSQWMEYVADASLSKAIVQTKGRWWETHQPVGSGEVNRFGLYDLRGNVKEYSKDAYSPNKPLSSRVILGADWEETRWDWLQKSNKAGFRDISKKSFDVGFRCVLVPVAME